MVLAVAEHLNPAELLAKSHLSRGRCVGHRTRARRWLPAPPASTREGRRRSLKVEVKSRPESPNVKPGFGDPPADDRVIQEMPTCAPLQASSEDTIWRSAISLGISRPSCGPQLRPESTAAPPENGESRSSVSHAYLMAVLGKARLALCMIRIPARTTRMRCSTTI